jgi:predicted choloylglycine hydrolase
MSLSLTFDSVAETRPGPKWKARWDRSWPSYAAWFTSRGGDDGPERAECEAALARYMPELVPLHAHLTELSGGGDRAARFLSTWCPPAYLGGCSIAARCDGDGVRLLRNYDLSPELNEGLLLRSGWAGRPVMGMVEFLWGLSDGINDAGLAAAIAFGGRREVREGFGICTILRYLLETCDDVADARAALARIPSHMAYNVVLADRSGAVASVELAPGGGLRSMDHALATNHQHGDERPDAPGFTRTVERRAHLEMLFARQVAPPTLREAFLQPPLFRKDYAGGFGTLFTAEYEPAAGALKLIWPDRSWDQTLARFREGSRTITYAAEAPARDRDLAVALAALRPYVAAGSGQAFEQWLASTRRGEPDWIRFGGLFAGARVRDRGGERSP